jgi:hypothetical protein
MKILLTALASVLAVLTAPAALAENGHITCTGVLVEVDMNPQADFPMVVIYDNSKKELEPHTCVLDVGSAGHWPLRGICIPGMECTLSGPYYKKIGNTYYMRDWDKGK